jgi:hypothetical protein
MQSRRSRTWDIDCAFEAYPTGPLGPASLYLGRIALTPDSKAGIESKLLITQLFIVMHMEIPSVWCNYMFAYTIVFR